MKIEEAIEIKELHYIADKFDTSEEYDEADLLSIEALKRTKENRKTKLMVDIGLLPGETK